MSDPLDSMSDEDLLALHSQLKRQADPWYSRLPSDPVDAANPYSGPRDTDTAQHLSEMVKNAPTTALAHGTGLINVGLLNALAEPAAAAGAADMAASQVPTGPRQVDVSQGTVPSEIQRFGNSPATSSSVESVPVPEGKPGGLLKRITGGALGTGLAVTAGEAIKDKLPEIRELAGTAATAAIPDSLSKKAVGLISGEDRPRDPLDSMSNEELLALRQKLLKQKKAQPHASQ